MERARRHAARRADRRLGGHACSCVLAHRLGVVVRHGAGPSRGDRGGRRALGGGAADERAHESRCAKGGVSHRRGAERHRRPHPRRARAARAESSRRTSSRRRRRSSADTLPAGAQLEYAQGGSVASAPTGAGIWNVLLAVGNAIRPVVELQRHHDAAVQRQAERAASGLYYVGNWPSERGVGRAGEGAAGGVCQPGRVSSRSRRQNADTPGVGALQASRFSHARPAERLAEVHRAAAEARRQARARARRPRRPTASTSTA